MKLDHLKKEQEKLSKKIITKDEYDEINLVAGCDQAYVGDKIVSAVVVMKYPSLEFVEKKYAVEKATMPYISGFLSYRESPAVTEAFNKLNNKPDILLVESNGILHPRKLGMASHLGLMLDIPTIGVAKKLLLGEEKKGKIYVDGEVRAQKVDTKEHANPIIVSIGHRVSLKTAVEISKKCIVGKHKLPEPIHNAHKYSNKVRKRLIEESKQG